MNQGTRMVKARLSWFRHYHIKSHNIAKTCRYFGISQSTYYMWLKRFNKKGKRGLKNLSKRPHNSPNIVSLAMVREVIKIRKQLRIGPQKISKYLLKTRGFTISDKTVYQILKTKKLNKLSKIRSFRG